MTGINLSDESKAINAYFAQKLVNMASKNPTQQHKNYIRRNGIHNHDLIHVGGFYKDVYAF